MKKIISFVLTFSIIFTLFAIIPVIISEAQNPPVILTDIDFDAEINGDYSKYKAEGQDKQDEGFKPFINLDGDTHRNVYSLYFITAGHYPGHRGYLLRNSKSATNEPLKLEYDKYYKISVDYKNVKTTNRWYNISIIWVSDPDTFMTDNTLTNQFSAGKYNVFETHKDSAIEEDWKKATGVITPPDIENVYPVLVVYNYGLQNARTEKVYMDNIVVSEYEFKTSNTVDFDYEATEGYKYYYHETKPETQVPPSLTDLNDGNHDNVFSIGLTGDTISQRTYAIREEGTDDPLPLEFGRDYTIKLSYKNKKSQADYSISVAWVENPSIAALTGLPSTYSVWTGTTNKVLDNASVPKSYTPVSESPYIEDIATNISGGLSERDWVTVTATITPYSSKKIYPVILIRSAQKGLLEWQAIFIDDIKITAGSKNEVTFIDFDAEAQGDYSTEYYIEEGQDRINQGMAPFKEVNGNNVYGVYTTCGGHDGAMRGYALRDSNSQNNAPLKLQYGTNYKIRLDYKNIKTSQRWHNIAVIWVDNPNNFTSADLQTQFLAGKYNVFETFAENSAELPWNSATGIITPPDEENLHPVLVVYNYGATIGGGVEVLFDNISVSKYEFVYSSTINFDYEVEEKDYKYYYHETRSDRPATLQTLNNDEHKNAFHIGVTMASGSHRTYVIRQEGTADPLPLQYGYSYDIKLNYKNVKTLSDYNIAVAWVENPSIALLSGVPGDYYAAGAVRTNASIPESYNPINSSANAGLYVQQISEDITKSSTEGPWVEISGTITPPDTKRIYPVIIVRTNGGPNIVESIYIDDIFVQIDDGNKIDETNIDFDIEADEKYTYYQGGSAGTQYPAFKNVNNNNVYAVYSTKKSEKDLQKGYLLRNSSSVLQAPLELIYGNNYKISMEYKNLKSKGTYYVAIAWVENPDNVKNNFKPKNITKLAMIAPNSDNTENWRTIEGIITPPDSEKLYPVLFVYSNGTHENNLEICFDNISVKRTDETVIPTQYDSQLKVDFDTGCQPSFYSVSNNDFTYRLYNENGDYFVTSFDGYGTSAMFDRYASSTSTKDNPVVVSSIRTIGLSNTEGTRFANLKPGAILDISVDINVVTSVESDFYVGIAFASTEEETATAIGGYCQYGGLYNLSVNGMLCDIAQVDGKLSNWQTVEGTIVVPEHTNFETAWLVFYKKVDFGAMFSRGQEIYVDNIKVNTVGTAHKMSFVTNGGSEVKNVYYCKDSDTVIPAVPKREGYEFAGWYYDSGLSRKYDYNSKMPDKDLTLYADWSTFPSGLTATTLKTGFEQSDYTFGNIPYTNVYSKGQLNTNNVTDDVNSSTVTVYKDCAISAKTGEGYLEFENRLRNNSESSVNANAAAMLNKDGSNYYIVKGNRYRIKYAVRVLGTNNNQEFATPVIALAVSGLTPATGLSMPSVTVLDRFNYHPKTTSDDNIARESTWVYHEAYFEATETGKAYMIMFDDTYRVYSNVLIDDLEIVPASDEPITKVTYESYDGNKTYGSSLGCPDTAIESEFLADVRNGYVFDGWRDEDGNLFTFDKFPSNDITLKASYKESAVTGGQASINWDKPITADFENADLATTFYLDRKNVSNTQTVGLKYVTDDANNAHSGDSYFKFHKIMGDYQFKIYADGTPDNYIWLDKNSEYLVSYYIKVTDMPAAYRARYTIGTFNSPTSATDFTAAQTYDYLFSEKRNEWIKVEQRLTTKDAVTALGIRVSGGPVTTLIDDVKVIKLGIVTVKFESNGGSAVEDIQLSSMDYAIEPEYPTKDGYIFDGWYTDKDCKNLFKFTETVIEYNITLYAKWVVYTPINEESENTDIPKKQYTTVYDTEYVDEIVENDLSEYGFDDVPVIDTKDKIQKTDKVDTDTNNFPWVIMIIVIAVLVVAVTIVAVIMIFKKRKGVS